MKRAWGYLRVSKDPKLEKVSPATQRRLITDACQARRWDLVRICEDVDVPSRKIGAVGTWDSLAKSVQPGDVVVTLEYTRIGRSLREMLARIDALQKAGAELVSLEQDLDTTTAAGKLQLHVLLVLAEFERDRLSERLRGTHAQIARDGRWGGGGVTPLGYSYTPGSGILEVHAEEAEVVRGIYALRDEGYSMHAILREMDRRGARGKLGGRLAYSTVAQTLRNPVYTGKRRHRGEVYPARHEAIIDEALWERVQARRRTGAANNQRYLLSGMLFCDVCGSKLIHQTSSYHGTRRGYYACNRARRYRDTPMVTIEEQLAERWVTEALFGRLDDKRLQEAKARARRKAPKARDKMTAAKAQLARVESSLARLISDYYDAEVPLLTPEQFRRKNNELIERKAGLEATLQELVDHARLTNVVQLSERRVREVRASWEGMTLDERREVLRLFMSRVTVKPRQAGGAKLQQKRLRVHWR